MPDNFTQTLREGSARFADTVTPNPADRVRARGDQRRRRITAAASAAVVVAVIAAGAGGLYALGPAGRTVSPQPVTSITAPAPTSAPSASPSAMPTGSPQAGPTSPASEPASQTAPASGAASGLAALAGEWKQTDGALEALYIFRDGMIGLGEGAGLYYPLCLGTLEPQANGVYQVYGCGSATLTLADGTLAVHLPGTDGGAGSTAAYVPATAPGPTAASGTGVPSWALGLWSEGDERIAIDPSGAVSWSFTPQGGGMITGTGTLEPVPGGGLRIVTDGGAPVVTGVWPVFHPADGGLVVVGGEGPLDFRLINAAWRF